MEASIKTKKKWYKTWWGVILLILFWPFSISYWIWKQKWHLRTRLIVLGLLWVAIFIIGHSDSNRPRTATVAVDTRCVGPDGKRIDLSPEECQKFNDAWKNKPQDSPTPTARQYAYDVVEKQENKLVTNYKVLILVGADAKAILMDVKKTCTKDCNISVYDDKKALQLEQEYDKLMSTLDTKPEQLTAWKKNNYVFVADHLVGYMSFDTNTFQSYPYKDWYYKQLTGK